MCSQISVFALDCFMMINELVALRPFQCKNDERIIVKCSVH